MCVVRGLQCLESAGIQITNDIDCPLLLLSKTVFTTRSTSILRAVSIVHECSGTCVFVNKAILGTCIV